MPHVIAYALMDSLYKDLGKKTFFILGVVLKTIQELLQATLLCGEI